MWRRETTCVLMGAAFTPSCAMMEACTSAVPRDAKVPVAPLNFATICRRVEGQGEEKEVEGEGVRVAKRAQAANRSAL